MRLRSPEKSGARTGYIAAHDTFATRELTYESNRIVSFIEGLSPFPVRAEEEPTVSGQRQRSGDA